MIRENETLAKLVGVKTGDTVLDAGCGVGGSSIFLGKTFNCKVHGITLSEDQVGIATESARKHEVTEYVTFSVADYHQTGFQDNYFDVIWFVESFCHSDEPQILLKEMFRILKPEGKIIIADGFLTKNNYCQKEQNILNKWLNNWAINTLPDLKGIISIVGKTGFNSITELEYSNEIKRSAFLLNFYANLALFYGRFLRLFGKTYGNEITIKNTVGAKYQFIAFRKKLWRYNVIVASK